MGSVIRPVFANGERLTAQRLNEIVEYLRTSLRRALLAPLSPGVAAGLILEGAGRANLSAAEVTGLSSFAFDPETPGVPKVTVSPGVAIDGAARILVSTRALHFNHSDIVGQIPNLAVGDTVLVSLGFDSGAADPDFMACAPTTGPSVSEAVKLFFSELPATDGAVASPAASAATPAPSAHPWADPIDQGRSAASYAVPLGSVVYQQDKSGNSTLIPSLEQRAGVMPRVGALRNSFGDISFLLDRTPEGVPAVGVTVPTVFWPTAPAFFTSIAGGPLVQAAVVAADLGRPPAGRPDPSANNVFEGAGGNSAPNLTTLPPATSGVLAVSMQFDSKALASFSALTQPSGFPLVLSQGASTQPMVSPPPAGMAFSDKNICIGLSAGISFTDPSSGLPVVPVATAGIIMAYVWVPLPASGSTPPTLPVGTPLAPSTTPIAAGSSAPAQAQWGLVKAVVADTLFGIVAQLAIPLTLPSGATAGAWVPAWVWVKAPLF